jgi:hypothetical protein
MSLCSDFSACRLLYLPQKKGETMQNNLPERRTLDESLIDGLWKRLRAIADRALVGTGMTGRDLADARLRGEIYLFIANLITRWVDRLEGDPEGPSGRNLERMLQEGMDELRDRLNGISSRRSTAVSASV